MLQLACIICYLFTLSIHCKFECGCSVISRLLIHILYNNTLQLLTVNTGFVNKKKSFCEKLEISCLNTRFFCSPSTVKHSIFNWKMTIFSFHRGIHYWRHRLMLFTDGSKCSWIMIFVVGKTLRYPLITWIRSAMATWLYEIVIHITRIVDSVTIWHWDGGG